MKIVFKFIKSILGTSNVIFDGGGVRVRDMQKLMLDLKPINDNLNEHWNKHILKSNYTCSKCGK